MGMSAGTTKVMQHCHHYLHPFPSFQSPGEGKNLLLLKEEYASLKMHIICSIFFYHNSLNLELMK
jgi:hypothetical protein